MKNVFLFQNDAGIRGVMEMLMVEHGIKVTSAWNENRAAVLVTTTKYDVLFLEFWQNTEEAVYRIIKEHRAKWHEMPEVVLMQQSPIPTRLFGVVDYYRVLNLPFNLASLEHLLK